MGRGIASRVQRALEERHEFIPECFYFVLLQNLSFYIKYIATALYASQPKYRFFRDV